MDCNQIQYSLYRIAYRLLVLQLDSGLDCVTLQTIIAVLNIHRADINAIDIDSLSSILHDIFYISFQSNSKLRSINICVGSTLELFQKIFGKKDGIDWLDVKIFLAVASHSRLSAKLNYIFDQLSKDGECLTTLELGRLFASVKSLLNFLGEATVEMKAAEEHILEELRGRSLDKKDFNRMFREEPTFLGWLQIFYRMKMTENTRHNARCNVCKTFPIIGLRYKCEKCVSYDQCQSCFLTGRTSKRHKVNHLTREYCHPITIYGERWSNLKRFVKRIRSGKRRSLRYLPVQLPRMQSQLPCIQSKLLITQSQHPYTQLELPHTQLPLNHPQSQLDRTRSQFTHSTPMPNKKDDDENETRCDVSTFQANRNELEIICTQIKTERYLFDRQHSELSALIMDVSPTGLSTDFEDLSPTSLIPLSFNISESTRVSDINYPHANASNFSDWFPAIPLSSDSPKLLDVNKFSGENCGETSLPRQLSYANDRNLNGTASNDQSFASEAEKRPVDSIPDELNRLLDKLECLAIGRT